VSRLSLSARLLIAGLIAGAAALALYVFPSESYIFLPNRAHAVAPLVEVEGGSDPQDGGGVYYVDVLVRKATLLERLWPGVREGASVVPAEQVRPEGVDDAARRREELAEMELSQRVAAAVALRELGRDVVARPIGARIEFVDPDAPAAGKLRAGDVVVSVDGDRVTAPSALRAAIREAGVERELTLRVQRGERRVDVSVRPERGPEGVPMLGVIVSQAADIRLPVDVEIDTGGVGGPSAGLAFALDLLEELGRDVDGGRKIAVTGTLELDGSVGAVGGIKQKTIGVERADIDLFVVPAGENAAEARRHADGIRIVPVTTFQQALRTLATLPASAQD
jgi:PDZ domain-containing protein